MLTTIKRVLIGIAIILALLFAKAIFEDRQSEQKYQRAMDLMGRR